MTLRLGVPAVTLFAVLALAAAPARAACPIELAVFGDRDDAASVEFLPTGESVTVTNTFRMVLG
ncbi:hypothetical protein AB4144_58910, partial [Rhizobiaceae sp. 2RAB30]